MRLSSLATQENHNTWSNEIFTIKPIIRSLIWGVLSISSVNLAHAKANENIVVTTEYDDSNQNNSMPSPEFSSVVELWEESFMPNGVPDWHSINKSREETLIKYNTIIDRNHGVESDELTELRRLLANDKSIKVFNIVSFTKWKKSAKKNISNILDQNFWLWCAEALIFKWRREFQVLQTLSCNSDYPTVQTASIGENVRNTYLVEEDGEMFEYIFSNCKLYKKRKWRDPKRIENWNIAWQLDFLDNWDQITWEDYYNSRCITKRSEWSNKRWSGN